MHTKEIVPAAGLELEECTNSKAFEQHLITEEMMPDWINGPDICFCLVAEERSEP